MGHVERGRAAVRVALWVAGWLWLLVAAPGPSSAQVQKGSKPFVTILCRFADSTDVTPHPKAWYQGLMSSAAPGLDHFWREVSYGSIDLSGSVVTGWHNLPHPKSYYMVDGPLWRFDEKKLIADAAALADSAIDFRQFYGINVMLNVDVAGVSVGWEKQFLTLDGESRAWGATVLPITKQDHATVAHEMGHAFGLPHSCGPYLKIYDSMWDTMSGGGGSASDWGRLGLHTIAYHKDRLGWVPAARKYVGLPGTSQTITLERLAQPISTSNHLMAQVFIAGLGSQFYTVEARNPVGYDENGLPCDGGVIIHKVDIFAAEPAKVVDPDNDGDTNDEGACWLPGETFIDTTNGITIAVNSASASAYSVTITVGAAPLPWVVTNTLDLGAGSLRNALHYCNQIPGSAVQFKIPALDPGFAQGVFTFRPGSPYPDVTAGGTVVDGATQTAFGGDTNPFGPEILIDGAVAGVYTNGLTIAATGCVVRNLALGRFGNAGIAITGPRGGGAIVQGCYLGTNAAGTAALANGWGGVAIWGGSTGNQIGGTSPGQGNLLSGNTQVGISINDFGSSGNLIMGNRVGTNAAGTAALPNGWAGVSIQSAALDNTVGGLSAGARNIISGNGAYGVAIGRSDTAGRRATNNRVQGNWIGTNGAGTLALPNGYAGVGLYEGAQANTIGGSTTAAANVISGNTSLGVAVSGEGTDGNSVQGNQIGTDAGGAISIANGWGGVQVSAGARSNLIGGPGAGNVISGNGQLGVSIIDPGTQGNLVQGNLIGTNGAGTAALPNGWGGAQIYGGAKGNTIGGDTAGARNILSGNVNYGVAIVGGLNNRVEGNYVGTNAAGTAALPNGFAGVGLFGGAKENVVAANVLSGNAQYGAHFADVETAANRMTANRIGLAATGAGAVPNGFAGVVFWGGATNNLVGGPAAADGNTIANHPNEGILLLPDAGAGNTLRANRIYGNARLAINLSAGTENSHGVNTNDVGDADTGPNNLLNYPTISKVVFSGGVVTVKGSISALPNTAVTIDLYSLSPIRKHVSGHGGAESYLGSATTTTNGSGVGTFTVASSGPKAGDLVCLAAVDTLTGDTSELGPNATVPAATLSIASLALDPERVDAGQSSSGTVTLSDPAPAGGAAVALSSADPGAATVPSSILVPAGAVSASFTVSTGAGVGEPTGVTISGTYGGVTRSAALTIDPPGVSSLTLNPATVIGGQKSVGTVTIAVPAPAGGAVVALSSSGSPTASVPPSVIVSEGSRSVTFQVTTAGVAAQTEVTIAAKWNGVEKSAKLIVKPAELDTFTLSSSSVTGGLKVTGTVTLTGFAPTGGRAVSLASSHAAAEVPATVTIPGGQTKATFSVTTSIVSARTLAKITAKLGTVTKPADLVVTPYNAADLNGDGYSDLVLQNSIDRRIAILTMEGTKITSSYATTPTLPENWRVAAVADFNRDLRADIAVQNRVTRAISILFLEGAAVRSSVSVNPTLPANWEAMAAADIDRDGKPDLIVQNMATQQVSALLLDGAKILKSQPLSQNLAPNWRVCGAADFTADGKPDLVVQNIATRQISILVLDGTRILSSKPLYPTLPADWSLGAVGDYNGDGLPDLVAQNSQTRQISVLTVANLKITASISVNPAPQEGWVLEGPK